MRSRASTCTCFRSARRSRAKPIASEGRLLESAIPQMASATTRLDVKTRAADGSRAARRLRRESRVPGILYGGSGDAVSFDADARELRLALASSGAVLDLSV